MFDIESLFSQSHPDFYRKHPRLSSLVINTARKLWKEKEFQAFAKANSDVNGVALIERGFQQINFDLKIDNAQQCIPQTGRLILIANHPLGYLDGVGLLKAVSQIRPDVKMVINGALHNMLGMQELTIPVDNFRGSISRNALRQIKQQLDDDGVLIIFPSGLVSRKINGEICDLAWNPSFLRFSADKQAPVIPLFIDGENSPALYQLMALTDPLAKTLLIMRELVMMKLLREIFTWQSSRRVTAYAGDAITPSELISLPENTRLQWVRQRLYALKP